MKLSPTLAILLVACVFFVFSTYIPSWLLSITLGTQVGALLMLVLVLVVLQLDIVLGLATFLAVAALFLENRRRTVRKVTTMMGGKQPFEIEELSTPAPPLVPGEIHPEREESETEDYGFEPTEESGKNTVESLGAESQDEKQPLETVPPQPSLVSEMMQQKGLAAI